MEYPYEKCKKLVNEIHQERVHFDGINLPKYIEQVTIEKVSTLLREQDRDTRHACAEAVLQADDANHAHDICMNC